MDRNSNNLKDVLEIFKFVRKTENDVELESFFKELLTESEIETLSKRWRILNMLKNGASQRAITKELQVSLCKVTRGAKILKNSDSVLMKYLIKEKDNE